MEGLLLFLALLFVVIFILWINDLNKRRSTASKGGQWVDVPFEIVKGTPGPGGYVEETLIDDGENYYHVKRGGNRTYVRQWRPLPGSWKIAIYETMLMGGHYHLAAAQRFLKARTPWLNLEREPTNQYDPNAIKVMSTWRKPDGSVHREHLGYVGKEEAALIGGDLSPDHPIAATIDAMGPSDKYGASVHFTIHVGTSWCPHCKGDLGRAPRKPGTCNSCGGGFELSPHFGVAIPA